MNAILVDGLAGKLSVRVWDGPGDAVPVCFVHPINTGGAVWDVVAKRISSGGHPRTLRSAGRRCIVPDLRGHGGSDPGGPYHVDDYVADVLAVLDQLDIDRVHVAGGSVGGPVGVALAAAVPDRIVTVAGFGVALALRLPDGALEQALAMLRAQGTRSTFEVLAPGAVAPGADPALAALVVELASGVGRGPELVGEIMVGAFTADVTPRAAKVHVPCLVANGTDDATCTPADARRMGEALADCRVEVLDGVGHLPMLERPAVVARLLEELFVKGAPS
jgi:pimeloyl-ACP methyl ester carboxylesterase